jgi:hypothetical protein
MTMESNPLDDVFRLRTRTRENEILRHSGYVSLAQSVIEQAWLDARVNTLDADSDKARQWLQTPSMLLEMWCALAGIPCESIMAKARREFGG